jgi:site-specific DNA-methyltransferase (adenine-specific)
MIELKLGDCLEFMKGLDTASVDAVITDPPYNVGLNYSDGDNREDYAEWCSEWLKETRRISRGCVAISCGIGNLISWNNIDKPDWVMAWVKRNSIKRVATGWNTWEPVLIYGKILGKKTHDSFIVNMAAQKDTGTHPCPKPLGWALELIDRATKEGMTVFDPFMGSGTTGVACVKLGRNFIGCEINPDYFAIAQRRIAEAQLQAPLPALA